MGERSRLMMATEAQHTHNALSLLALQELYQCAK